MGKMKRQKSKIHNKPLKAPGNNNLREIKEDKKTKMTKVKEKDVPVCLPDNMFGNISISNQLLAQKLPDFDARSSVTSKSLKGLNLKKKEKRKIKHDLFMEKIDAIKTAKKKAKEKKKREKTPVVGDMSVIEDALPTLELLLKQTSKKEKHKPIPTKVRGVQKERKRRKQMLSDMLIFKQVLQHPAFKKNPTETITEHLHNKMQQEEVETDQQS